MNDTKTILLIGRTGDGKSTLANVITGTNKFTEGEFIVSETRKISDYTFEYEETKYRIIDTIGIGDTNMRLDKVLRKLALMSYSVKNGLSQILFVTGGYLAREAKSTYDLLEKVVFDENIFGYTTIVRTRFDGFRDDNECDEEKTRMINENEDFKELIEKCGSKIICVDNPQIDISDKKVASFNKKRREVSRKILLDHLKSVYQGDPYKPSNLSILSNLISGYMKEKEELKGSQKVAGKKLSWLEEAENIRLNKKITKKILKHIGNIDSGLKEVIKEGLKKREPIEWLFEKKEAQQIQESK